MVLPIITIKNTFIDIPEDLEESPKTRRSSSVPAQGHAARGWGEPFGAGQDVGPSGIAPGYRGQQSCAQARLCPEVGTPMSDASTEYSDHSEGESAPERSPFALGCRGRLEILEAAGKEGPPEKVKRGLGHEKASAAVEPAPQVPASATAIVPLRLSEFIGDGGGGAGGQGKDAGDAQQAPSAGARTSLRTTLNRKANLFRPTLQAPPAELLGVVGAAHAALAQDVQVCRAHVMQGPMGGVTTVVAEVWDLAAALDRLLDLARQAILRATDDSALAYVMSSECQPFKAFGTTGISASVAYMPLELQQKACWDMCRRGSCPRPQYCRWSHPTVHDLIQLVVVVKSVCA